MGDLEALTPLRRAWDYQAPRQPAQCLPLVYGDMQGGGGGLWRAVCLDTGAGVYALAGHPLLGLMAGNQVTLYGRDDLPIDPAAYALDLDHDFQGRGRIATATFAGEVRPAEPLTVRAQGKPDAQGCLLVNPLDVAVDFLVEVCGLDMEELDPGDLARSRVRAEALGYRASGVIQQPQSVASQLTELLATFLGSWWRAGSGLLRLMLDLGPGSVSDGELAASLNQSELKDVSVSVRLADVVNRAEALYRHNPERREFEAGLDGQDSQDLASQALYGLQRRVLELKWVRDAATAGRVARALVEGYGAPRRVITCQEGALGNLALEKGDVALLSLDWLYDQEGRPLVNQITRVLAVEPQLDRGAIAFTLLDSGFHKTTAHPADGSRLADGRGLAGGERDRTEYRA